MNNAALKLNGKMQYELLGLAEIHPEFLASLTTLDRMIEGRSNEERKYQSRGLGAICDGMLRGEEEGQLILGTGGGKTTIAMQLAQKTKGRVLWMAPSQTALDRAIEEIFKNGSKKKWNILKAKNFKKIIADGTEIIFATSQMLVATEKFSFVNPTHFSLIISDEAHHMMGPMTQEIFNHFQAFKLYMTATPETCTNHLDRFAKPWFHYSSDDLIKNDKFPPWMLCRYEVKDEKIYEAKTSGDNYKLEEGQEDILLDMPARFSILKKILRQTVAAGEKTMCFLPSVKSSKKFVTEMIANDPILRGRVAHVDGKSLDRDEIERKFKSGEILAVCCKDLWSESLDVPEIKHVSLADPCSSMRVLMQRIGRGCRRAEGKEHLVIHDIVSVVDDIEVLRSKKTLPLTVAGALGIKKTKDGIILNGPEKGKNVYDADSLNDDRKVVYLDRTNHETFYTPYFERLIDMSFMSRAEAAVELYKKFARMMLIGWENLVFFPKQYLNNAAVVKLRYETGRIAEICFRDVFESAKVYGSLEKLAEAARNGVQNIQEITTKTAEKVKDILTGKEIPDLDINYYTHNALIPAMASSYESFKFKDAFSKLGQKLNTILNKHQRLNPVPDEIIITWFDLDQELRDYIVVLGMNRRERKMESLFALHLVFGEDCGEHFVVNLKKTIEVREEITKKSGWPVPANTGMELELRKDWVMPKKYSDLHDNYAQRARPFKKSTTDMADKKLIEGATLDQIDYIDETELTDDAATFAYILGKHKEPEAVYLFSALVKAKKMGHHFMFFPEAYFKDPKLFDLAADFVFALRGSLHYREDLLAAQPWRFPLQYSEEHQGYFMPIDQVRIKWFENEISEKQKLKAFNYEQVLPQDCCDKEYNRMTIESFWDYLTEIQNTMGNTFPNDVNAGVSLAQNILGLIRDKTIKEEGTEFELTTLRKLALTLLMVAYKHKDAKVGEILPERTRRIYSQLLSQLGHFQSGHLSIIMDKDKDGDLVFLPKAIERSKNPYTDSGGIKVATYGRVQNGSVVDSSPVFCHLILKHPNLNNFFARLIVSLELGYKFISFSEKEVKENFEALAKFILALRDETKFNEPDAGMEEFVMPLSFINGRYYFPIMHIQVVNKKGGNILKKRQKLIGGISSEEKVVEEAETEDDPESVYRVLHPSAYKRILGKLNTTVDVVAPNKEMYSKLTAIYWGIKNGKVVGELSFENNQERDLFHLAAVLNGICVMDHRAANSKTLILSEKHTKDIIAREKETFEHNQNGNGLHLKLKLDKKGMQRFTVLSNKFAIPHKVTREVGYINPEQDDDNPVYDTAAVFLYLINNWFPVLVKYFDRLLETKKRGLNFMFFTNEELTQDFEALAHFILAMRDTVKFEGVDIESAEFNLPLYRDRENPPRGFFFPVMHINIDQAEEPTNKGVAEKAPENGSWLTKKLPIPYLAESKESDRSDLKFGGYYFQEIARSEIRDFFINKNELPLSPFVLRLLKESYEKSFQRFKAGNSAYGTLRVNRTMYPGGGSNCEGSLEDLAEFLELNLFKIGRGGGNQFVINIKETEERWAALQKLAATANLWPENSNLRNLFLADDHSPSNAEAVLVRLKENPKAWKEVCKIIEVAKQGRLFLDIDLRSAELDMSALNQALQFFSRQLFGVKNPIFFPFKQRVGVGPFVYSTYIGHIDGKFWRMILERLGK